MILGSDIIARHIARAAEPWLVLSTGCSVVAAVALWRLLGELFLAGWLAGALIALVGALHVARRMRAEVTAALCKLAMVW